MTFKMNEFTSSEFDTKSYSMQHSKYFKITQPYSFSMYIFEKDTIIQKTNEVKGNIWRIGRTLE